MKISAEALDITPGELFEYVPEGALGELVEYVTEKDSPMAKMLKNIRSN